jgi:hypothetical protein
MSKIPPTPPAEFDLYALEQARRLAQVDRHRLKGGDVQFKAMIQCAIVDAMMHAADLRRRPHITVHSTHIELSPAMPLSDEEMAVLRRLASRIKANTGEGGEVLPPVLGLVRAATEDGTAEKPAPGQRETACGVQS